MQQDVDEQIPGGRLVVVARVGRGCCLGGCDLNLQIGDLRLMGGQSLVLLRQLAGVGLVLLLELRSEAGDLLARQRRGFGGSCDSSVGASRAVNEGTPFSA